MANKARTKSSGRSVGVASRRGVAARPRPESWLADVLAHLAQWQERGALEDCPLPELYRSARQAAPGLSIGHFHDGLRTLRERRQIELHPWTGPLYEIPEPAVALLIGHAIVYYASARTL